MDTESQTTEDADRTGPKPRVAFEFEKANGFRVIHCDGVTGAVAPGGKRIHMAIFSERFPIVKREVYEVDEDGRLGPEPIERKSRDAILREVEVSILMDLTMAKQMRSWLDQILRKADGDEVK